MTTKYVYLLLASMLSCLAMEAQVAVEGQVAVQEEAPVSDTLEKALLWEISGDSINTSYLFGTIHLIPEEDFFLPPGTDEAIAASSAMVFEIDLKEMMEDPMAQIGLFMKAFMNNGTTLRDLLDEDEYQMVKAHFDEIGLPLMIFERVKPMFLSVFASGDFSMNDMSMASGGSKSYEMEFLTIADEKSMDVGGLETMEFQISMFDSIPYDVQAQMLVESIAAEEEGSDQMDALIAIYKDQDVEGLFSVLGDSEDAMMEYEDMLVSGRNKNWIPVMEEVMKKESAFFAVGAGHLGGKNGVIRLLRDAGYTLRPISHADSEGIRTKQRF
jgi:uncharacterized protein YbaP (TraB family)